jgi:asparagine synthase (glutamine-hydrolysing)
MVMYTRRVVERDWKYLHPRWLRPELRAELDERHLALALAAERARRFASPARESEYRQMYPPEVGVRTAGWPLQLWRPFADRRLHAFLLAIPPEQKFEPHPATDEYYAGAKQIVRRGMQGILPESVRRRTEKTHFASLLQDEFVRRWANYEAAFGPNGRSEVVERGYVDRERFWERLNLIRSGIWPPDFLYVMRMLGVETWLRTFGLPRAQLARVPARFVEGAALPAGSGSAPAPV